jgi:predicted nucleotidyltransferase
MESLKGENLIEQYERIAEQVRSRIVSVKGVSGILYTGALVRGFADRHSDVDLIVFLQKGKGELKQRIRKIGADEQQKWKIEIDLEVHYIEDFEKRVMTEINMWDYSRSKIVFDPRGRIKQLLKRKLRVPKSYWVEQVVPCAEYVDWYCCPQRKSDVALAETWIERGDPVSAHYCINYAIDLLLKIIYALNKEFVPPPKWTIFYSYNLNWLPHDFKRRLEEALKIQSVSVTDLKRRLGEMRSIWTEVVSKMENDTGLTRDLIAREFRRNIVHQT